MMAGYDTAGTVQGVWGSAVQNKFGNPAFWIRYFSPSNYRPVNYSSTNANAECHVVWTSGAKHLGCVSTPSRLDGTYAGKHSRLLTGCRGLAPVAAGAGCSGRVALLTE